MIVCPKKGTALRAVSFSLQAQIQHLIHADMRMRLLRMDIAVLQRFLQVSARGMFHADLLRRLRLIFLDKRILAARHGLIHPAADILAGMIGIREDDHAPALLGQADERKRLRIERRAVGLDRLTIKILLQHIRVVFSFDHDHFSDLHVNRTSLPWYYRTE